jgi:hypothetical protein
MQGQIVSQIEIGKQRNVLDANPQLEIESLAQQR